MGKWMILVWAGLLVGCSVYDDATKGLARAVSPEYRAYEAQQKQLPTEQNAAQDREERKQLCEKSRC